MYSIDLTTISLGAFRETILTVDLLPSRRMLADGIIDLVPKLRRMGVENLEDVRRLLRGKRGCVDLAAGLGVDEKYPTILNREVNSYVSKPVPLSQLGVFSDPELERLSAAGIASTKALHERCTVASHRRRVAGEHDHDEDRLAEAVDLSDLVRINGVGPAFARFLRDLGIRGPHDLNTIDPVEVLDRCQRSIAGAPASGPDLQREDLDYCRRSSVHLSNDSERWGLRRHSGEEVRARPAVSSLGPSRAVGHRRRRDSSALERPQRT